ALTSSVNPKEGFPVTLTGTFLDPGLGESVSVAWQVADASGQPIDGQVSTSGAVSTFTFTPPNDDPYTATFLVRTDGGASPATLNVAVANVRPVITSEPAALTVAEGAPVTGRAAFTDPGADGWTALVDYGDGTVLPATVTGQGFSFGHAYADSGIYQIRATV